MKKLLTAFLISLVVFLTLVFSLSGLTSNNKDEFQVAMVTDFSDVNDASFNQACFEGAKEWSKKNNVKFNYYKPSDISEAERIKSMNLAIDRGYKVILCPGYALGKAIAEVAPKHLDVKFIGLDINPETDFPKGFQLTENIAIYNYREDIAGYLAGYAIAKEGYDHLGFLGGIPADPVKRFGYGFVAGIDAVAQETKQTKEVQYVYGGQFFGDSEIFKYIDNWYKVNDTKVVFSCGGSIYTSVALAAKENGGHMIGVDVDQGPIIDQDYGPGICITSALKGIKQTVINKLEDIYNNHQWETGIFDLGLVSAEDPTLNYVQLPINDWRMNNFSIDEYKTLVNEIIIGTRQVQVDIKKDEPVTSSYTKCYYRGSIKS